ncbi:hypothetical protein OQA88_6190 [Cercophora sp. LCS_1]
MARTIVVLGASYTGIPVAHYLLKHTAAKVKGGLKVILVSPNTDMYWCIAVVRGVVPDLMPDNRIFYPIAPAFAKYPAEQFEFIQGKAEGLDPKANTVVVRRNDGSQLTVGYDDVVIATGASYKEGPPFKGAGSTEETKAALHDWRKRIKNAKSIVVAGAGATGVEVVGELGEEYSAKGLKEVTLIADGKLPLPTFLNDDVRQFAKKELEKNKVNVLISSRVTHVTKKGNKTILEINDGEKTITTDLYLPTFGIVPSSSFLPSEMLDSAGFVKQTPHLRAQGHKNIYVIGDVGNLQAPRAITGEAEVVHVVKVIESDLLGTADPGEVKIEPKVMFGATLGRSRATGQMGNWRPWSWLIWFFKGRYLGTDYAQDYVNGLRTVSVKNW